MKAYIFSWNNLYTTEYVFDVLNDTQVIDSWVSPITNTAIIISNLNCIDLSSLLHGRLGETWFVLVEANSFNTGGWLPSNFWDYINDPKSISQKNYLAELIALHENDGLIKG